MKKRPVNFLMHQGESEWLCSAAFDTNSQCILKYEEHHYDDLRKARPRAFICRQKITDLSTNRFSKKVYSLIASKELIEVKVLHDRKSETITLQVGKRKIVKKGKL